MACVRKAVGPDALVLNEAISNYHVVNEHLRASRPGSLLNSGGGSLGWSGGAAVGAKLAATGAPPDLAARIFEARIPLARHACPEEIARSVLYLASSDSSFVTGSTLVVDGGMHT